MPVPQITFGTDGWRAVVADDFTYETVRAVAQAIAWHLGSESRPVVVGHDTRYCAELFAREVVRVLAANGQHVILLERPTPTPAISWTVVDRGAAGGVAITASHNPSEFNGIKYKPDFGGSASSEVATRIEDLSSRALREGYTTMDFDEACRQGSVEVSDGMPSYHAQLARMVDLPKLRGAGLRVLHEAMYGAGSGVLSAALDGGATSVDQLHWERNPGFGGMHPEPIARYVPEALARMSGGDYSLAVCNDGDADRVGIIDETGRFVNQQEMMALYAMYLLERRGLRGDLVRSLTSTSMLDDLGKRFNVPVHELPVGFKHIGALMRETDALMGAEESGGFAFRGHLPERDGILAGLTAAEMIVDYEMPLSRIVKHLHELVGPRAYDRRDIRFDRDGYAERTSNVYRQVREAPPAELGGTKVTGIRSDDGFKFRFEDGSWALVRMSGTEPIMRLYSEAETSQRVDDLIHALAEFIGVGEAVPAVARP
ncbi:MAG TPA: phosphoglucomutase/phosphomannomutase family protein [Candidatus Sulfotelmatobacter sp.]|nr:phosphoglucomutase/phosphomannomutase family protein [Candidatus Sulfotelmatobacter sp.]